MSAYLAYFSVSVDSFLVSFSQFHLILLFQYDRFLLTWMHNLGVGYKQLLFRFLFDLY